MAERKVVMKQVVSVIDSATTICCLDAAGQIRPVAQPFDTLQGSFDVPPFHIHCRSIAIPYVRGAVIDQRKMANKELTKRPLKMRDKRKYRRIPGPGQPVTVPTPAPSVVVPWRGPMTPEQATQAGKDLGARVTVAPGTAITEAADIKVRGVFRRLGERFPHAATRLRGPMVAPTGKPTAWADYTEGLYRIRVNPKILNSPWSKMQGWYRKEIMHGHWPRARKGTDYLYNTVTHEFGHHMHYLLENNVPRDVAGNMWREINDEFRRQVAIHRPAMKSMLNEMTQDEIIETFAPKIVSGYAGTNRYEFVAECFAEYLHSPDPSPMAKIVGRYFEDTFGPNSTVRLT